MSQPDLASEQKDKQAGKTTTKLRQYSPHRERVNTSPGLIEETAFHVITKHYQFLSFYHIFTTNYHKINVLKLHLATSLFKFLLPQAPFLELSR